MVPLTSSKLFAKTMLRATAEATIPAISMKTQGGSLLRATS